VGAVDAEARASIEEAADLPVAALTRTANEDESE